jgi:hypothetical protein
VKKKRGVKPRARKQPRPQAPLPQEQMVALLTGHWLAQMLFAVTKLGVPDVLGTKALAACCERSPAAVCSARTRAAASS